MSSPSQDEANGATRNTYNKAGYLVKVEEHNGTAWQTQSEMRYDGLGNRLEMTSYNEGVGETIRYQLDNGQPLAAVGAESTSFYLYGRGVIGTKTANWGYVLQDGLGSTRQLATHEGVIVMSVAYTPWGDVLEYYGSGGIDFGYLGGMYDDTTGLIYLGSGQYYDPVTGRMLTRGAGQSNPYKPGAFDPAGMMVAPLGLLGLVLGRKKKRGKWDTFVAVLVVCVVVGMSVSACGPTESTPVSPTQPPTGDTTSVFGYTNDGTMQSGDQPLEDIVLGDCDGGLLSFWKPTPTPLAQINISANMTRKLTDWEAKRGTLIAFAAESIFQNNVGYYVWGMENKQDEDVIWPPPRRTPQDNDTWGYNDSINVKQRTGGATPVVCADVVTLAYNNGGYSLKQFTDWINNGKYGTDPTRNSYALQDLVKEKGQLYAWNDLNYPELGDMVFFNDAYHTGVVAEIRNDGTKPNEIFIVQASYSQGIVNKMSLEDWQKGNTPVSFGHPLGY